MDSTGGSRHLNSQPISGKVIKRCKTKAKEKLGICSRIWSQIGYTNLMVNFICVIGFLWHFSVITSVYSEYEMTTEVDVKYPSSMLPPSITFCLHVETIAREEEIN